MPDITDKTSAELVANMYEFTLSPGLAAIVDELNGRIIEENDDDDTPQHRNGIRPGHAPILP